MALTNEKQVFLWGSNKQSQLGFDTELFPIVQTPRKLYLQEYMNSAVKEVFSQIFAAGSYTVLISNKSKHVYLCDKTTRKFSPVFGKTPGNFHFKKIDGSHGAWLSKEYMLVMDSVKNIYKYDLEGKKQKAMG